MELGREHSDVPSWESSVPSRVPPPAPPGPPYFGVLPERRIRNPYTSMARMPTPPGSPRSNAGAVSARQGGFEGYAHVSVSPGSRGYGKGGKWGPPPDRRQARRGTTPQLRAATAGAAGRHGTRAGTAGAATERGVAGRPSSVTAWGWADGSVTERAGRSARADAGGPRPAPSRAVATWDDNPPVSARRPLITMSVPNSRSGIESRGRAKGVIDVIKVESKGGPRAPEGAPRERPYTAPIPPKATKALAIESRFRHKVSVDARVQMLPSVMCTGANGDYFMVPLGRVQFTRMKDEARKWGIPLEKLRDVVSGPARYQAAPHSVNVSEEAQFMDVKISRASSRGRGMRKRRASWEFDERQDIQSLMVGNADADDALAFRYQMDGLSAGGALSAKGQLLQARWKKWSRMLVARNKCRVASPDAPEVDPYAFETPKERVARRLTERRRVRRSSAVSNESDEDDMRAAGLGIPWDSESGTSISSHAQSEWESLYGDAAEEAIATRDMEDIIMSSREGSELEGEDGEGSPSPRPPSQAKKAHFSSAEEYTGSESEASPGKSPGKSPGSALANTPSPERPRVVAHVRVRRRRAIKGWMHPGTPPQRPNSAAQRLLDTSFHPSSWLQARERTPSPPPRPPTPPAKPWQTKDKRTLRKERVAKLRGQSGQGRYAQNSVNMGVQISASAPRVPTADAEGRFMQHRGRARTPEGTPWVAPLVRGSGDGYNAVHHAREVLRAPEEVVQQEVVRRGRRDSELSAQGSPPRVATPQSGGVAAHVAHILTSAAGAGGRSPPATPGAAAAAAAKERARDAMSRADGVMFCRDAGHAERGERFYEAKCKLKGVAPLAAVYRELGKATAVIAHAPVGQPAQCEALADAVRANAAIERLELRDNRITSEGAHMLARALQENLGISEVSLRGNPIRCEGARAMSILLDEQKERMRLISMQQQENRQRRDSMGDVGSPEAGRGKSPDPGAAKAPGFGNLKYSSSFKGIIGVLRITVLELSGCEIRDAGVAAISQALLGNGRVNQILRVLNLSRNRVGNPGAAQLSEALRNNVTIEEVDLSWNSIGPSGGKSLARSLDRNNGMSNLKVLRLAWNGLENDAGEALGNMLASNDALVELDLSHCRISGEACFALAQGLTNNTTLLSLQLNGNPIGADGGRHLNTALEENDSLTRLGLQGSSFATVVKPTGESAGMTAGGSLSNVATFNQSHPDGHYELVLSRAAHVALVRQLFTMAEQESVDLKNLKIDGKTLPKTTDWAKHISDMTAAHRIDADQAAAAAAAAAPAKGGKGKGKGARGPNWRTGCLTVDVVSTKGAPAGVAPCDEDDILNLEEQLLNNLLSDFERLFLLRMLCGSLFFTCAQAKRLLMTWGKHGMGRELVEAATVLFTRVVDSENFEGMIDSMTQQDREAVLTHLGVLSTFRPTNPTAHYALNLARQVDKMLAMKLVRLAAAEVSELDLPRPPWYNVKFEGKRLEGGMPREWVAGLPTNGLLNFDYASARAPPEDAVPLNREEFADLVERCVKKDIPTEDAVSNLRVASVEVYVTVQQVVEITALFNHCDERVEVAVIFYGRAVDREHWWRVMYELQGLEQVHLLARLGFKALDLEHCTHRFRLNLMCVEEKAIMSELVRIAIEDNKASEGGSRTHFWRISSNGYEGLKDTLKEDDSLLDVLASMLAAHTKGAPASRHIVEFDYYGKDCFEAMGCPQVASLSSSIQNSLIDVHSRKHHMVRARVLTPYWDELSADVLGVLRGGAKEKKGKGKEKDAVKGKDKGSKAARDSVAGGGRVSEPQGLVPPDFTATPEEAAGGAGAAAGAGAARARRGSVHELDDDDTSDFFGSNRVLRSEVRVSTVNLDLVIETNRQKRASLAASLAAAKGEGEGEGEGGGNKSEADAIVGFVEQPPTPASSKKSKTPKGGKKGTPKARKSRGLVEVSVPPVAADRSGMHAWQREWDARVKVAIRDRMVVTDKSPMREIFEGFDLDGDGTLSVRELAQGLRTVLGTAVNEQDVEGLARSLGDGDDIITFEEFQELINKHIDHRARVRSVYHSVFKRAAGKAAIMAMMFGVAAKKQSPQDEAGGEKTPKTPKRTPKGGKKGGGGEPSPPPLELNDEEKELQRG